MDIKSLNSPVVRKRVRPLGDQGALESRRVWVDVRRALRDGDVARATSHKRSLEERQRFEETQRQTRGEIYHSKLFELNKDTWLFKYLPDFARQLFLE